MMTVLDSSLTKNKNKFGGDCKSLISDILYRSKLYTPNKSIIRYQYTLHSFLNTDLSQKVDLLQIGNIT